MEFLKKENLSKFIINNRIVFIFSCLVLVLILGRGITSVVFDPDMERFFPQGHAATSLSYEIDETFIRTDNLVIAINAKNNSIFTKKTLFNGKVGIFEIKNNKINHILNFYKVENEGFKKIF